MNDKFLIFLQGLLIDYQNMYINANKNNKKYLNKIEAKMNIVLYIIRKYVEVCNEQKAMEEETKEI